jgi:hypothetical protein
MTNEPQESILSDGRKEGNQIIKWPKLIKLQAENWNLYKFLKNHNEMLIFTVNWHSLSPLCILSSFGKKGKLIFRQMLGFIDLILTLGNLSRSTNHMYKYLYQEFPLVICWQNVGFASSEE